MILNLILGHRECNKVVDPFKVGIGEVWMWCRKALKNVEQTNHYSKKKIQKTDQHLNVTGEREIHWFTRKDGRLQQREFWT